LARPVTVTEHASSNFDIGSHPELVLGEDIPWVLNSSLTFGESVDFVLGPLDPANASAKQRKQHEISLDIGLATFALGLRKE
jgi:hypothetical protein